MIPQNWRDGSMHDLGSGKCLDGGYGVLNNYPCNGSSVQIWHDIQPTSSPYYEIKDGGGLCADGGQGSGLFPCNGLGWQEFNAIYAGTYGGQRYYTFQWVHDPSRCLDGGSAWKGNAIFFPCNGNNWQKWAWN